MEEPVGGPSPVLLVVQKRLRAAKKKLTRIQELEALQASGKELSAEQVPTVKSKAGVQAIIDELQKVDEGLRDALKEEQAAAFARGAAHAEALAQEQAAQVAADMQQQINELSDGHAAALAKAEDDHQKALDDQLDQLQRDAEAGKAEAAQAAADAAIKEALAQDMSETHPLKDIIVEPLRKLLTLLYFSQLFDVHHSPYLARQEVYACLQYDAQVERKEGQAALTDVALWEIAYFGRTLIDRMHNQVSHQQFLTTAVDLALSWVLEPDKVAIPSPPAPTPITMGELQTRILRVIASKFSQVVPASGPPPPDVASLILAPPPPPPPPHTVQPPASSTAPPAASYSHTAPPAFPIPPPHLPPLPHLPIPPDATAAGVTQPLPTPLNPSPPGPVPSMYPPMQLLPSFFKDTTDGDTHQNRVPSAPSPVPLAGTASNMVVPGMYVLSEAGIPQLRSSAPAGPPPHGIPNQVPIMKSGGQIPPRSKA